MGKHDFFKRNRHSMKKREKRDTFLIVCEGERTEPNYFNKFPIKKEVITLEIHGEGMNTDSLVKEAISRKRIAEREGTPYIQVWVVFDRDSFPAERFQNAIKLCDENKIHYAITNEAFELWYMLHFNYYDSAMSRTQYSDKLSQLLDRKYEKNLDDIYDLLKDKQDKAIANANRLRKFQFESNNNRHDYCNTNPVTTVQDLVLTLNEFIDE